MDGWNGGRDREREREGMDVWVCVVDRREDAAMMDD